MTQFTNAWHALYKNTTENFNRKYATSTKTRKNRKSRKLTRKNRRQYRK